MRRYLITCEHGGNWIPEKFAHLRSELAELIETHRGWDPGALQLARSFATALGAPLIYSETTRLLVDLNRSIANRRSLVHPAVRDRLTDEQMRELFDDHHRDYRRSVEQAVDRESRDAELVHIGVHSFTPVLYGRQRQAEVGILYDPARPREREFARQWKSQIKDQWPAWRVRFNYPYRGDADGLTTHLRNMFPGDRYLGIELEVNQAIVADESVWKDATERFPGTLPAVPT